MLLAEIGPRLHFRKPSCQRLLGGLLHPRVDRGVDPETSLVDLGGGDDLLEFVEDRVDGPAVEGVHELALARCDLLPERLLMLRVGDEFEFLHPAQDDIALPEGCLEVVEGRVTVGTADQSRKKGRLRETHVGCGFSEVGLARRLDPVETGAEVDAVHVELEDLLLGHLHLDAEGHGRLEELSVEGLAAEREAVAGQLLGDRAGPLLHSAEEKVPHGRTRDAERVDAAVLVES